MKPVRIITSVVIIIFSLYLVGSSISNLQNNEKKYDAETQILAQKLNDAFIEMLDICTTTNNIADLRGCKSISIPPIIEHCNDKQYPTTSVCSDIRLKEFSNTIDERIETANVILSNEIDASYSRTDALQFELIEHCSVLKTNLDYCKNSMLELKNECMRNESRDLPSCDDPRIEEILNREPLQSSDVIENSNNQAMDFLASCTLAKTESSIKNCVDTANKMIELCNIDASVQACNDPRLKEIANYDVQSIQDPEITTPYSSEQIPIDNKLQAMYARTVRDCIEETTVFSNYVLTLVNLDSISDELNMSVNSMAQDRNVSCGDIKEIESNYCYLFNPSCTETGRFEAYWEIMPKLNSSFEQICTNTGQFCGFNYKEN